VAQVQLAVQLDASPMVRSFALVYVEMGISRAPATEQLQAVSSRTSYDVGVGLKWGLVHRSQFHHFSSPW